MPKPDLSVQLGKVRLLNPVLTASGTCGYGREYGPYMDLSRLGGRSLLLNDRRRDACLSMSFTFLFHGVCKHQLVTTSFGYSESLAGSQGN